MALPPILTLTQETMTSSTSSQWNSRSGRSHTSILFIPGLRPVCLRSGLKRLRGFTQGPFRQFGNCLLDYSAA